MSSLSWLDFSEEDQRRAREIVAIFSQHESRDELGIGTIRDVFSQAMFPGTSVVQTRLRYFLFVPWIFRQAERQHRRGHRFLSWTDHQERRLIESLREGGDLNGLIGREAGVTLKTLPSAIYWGGITRHGILRRALTPQQLAGVSMTSSEAPERTELDERAGTTWHPNLPEPDAHFFDMQGCDFRLTLAEAEWLAERMLDAAPGTVLAHLASQGLRPSPTSTVPWQDATVRTAPSELLWVVRESARFSASMHGAALLYNVLLAERGAAMQVSADSFTEAYRFRLDAWSEGLADEFLRLEEWSLPDFWTYVRGANSRISLQTIHFVTEWIDAVRTGRAARSADDEGLRALVTRRELQQKGGQARLANDRLMRQWSGASGTSPLDYRWPLVKTLLVDLIDGLERVDAGP